MVPRQNPAASVHSKDSDFGVGRRYSVLFISRRVSERRPSLSEVIIFQSHEAYFALNGFMVFLKAIQFI